VTEARPEDDVAFVERHLRIAVVLYPMVGVLIWVYAALTLDRPNRPLIIGISAFAVVAALGPIDRSRQYIAASRHTMAYLYCLGALAFSYEVPLACLDGGARSPMVLLLIVVLCYAGLAYLPRAVLTFTGMALGCYASVVLAVPDGQDGAVIWATACVIALIGLLSYLAANNQWRSRNELLALTNRLEHLAMVDAVTGCLNRRAMWQRLKEEIALANRNECTVSLLLVDIDHFKEINDTYGHLAGDKVLYDVGVALLDNVRQCDGVGRIGGDEFAIVLPGMAVVNSQRIAERIVKAVQAITSPATGAVTGAVTVSVGLAEFPRQATDAEHLYEAADRALYEVKAAGRNGVASAS
jgi:diguanylate cyclase (GGDEF)-like protein